MLYYQSPSGEGSITIQRIKRPSPAARHRGLPFRGRTGLGWPAAGGRLVVRAAAVIEPPRRCATARGVASEAQAAPSGLMRREFSLHVAERNSFLFQADPRSDPVKPKILE